MYYLQSRYYDPNTGRFINADALVSTGQGILGNNMFTYCNNNPASYYDPSGAAAISVCNGDRNPLFIGYWGLGGGVGGGCGGTGGSEYKDIIEEVSNKTKKTMSSIGSVLERGFNMQQEFQMQDAQMTLDGAITVYEHIDSIGFVSTGKIGYKTYQTTSAFAKAGVYYALPIPTLIDELFACGYVLKGLYHLEGCVKEVVKWIQERT